jgi:hypothetical protein
MKDLNFFLSDFLFVINRESEIYREDLHMCVGVMKEGSGGNWNP